MRKIVIFQPKAHAPLTWDGVPRALLQCLHSRGAQQHPQGARVALGSAFLLFSLIFLCVFFLETCLVTWNIISSLCNVFRDLLNHHPLSFQTLLRCFVLPICMILHWITSKHLRIAWFGNALRSCTVVTWLRLRWDIFLRVG